MIPWLQYWIKDTLTELFYSTFLYLFFLYAYSTLCMIVTSDTYFYLMKKDLFIYKISKFFDTGETHYFSITHELVNKTNENTEPGQSLSVSTPIPT